MEPQRTTRGSPLLDPGSLPRDDSAVLETQLAEARVALPGINQTARVSRTAFDEHNVAIGPYVDAQMAALTKQVEIATLLESLSEARVGLQALLGNAVPEDRASWNNHEN